MILNLDPALALHGALPSSLAALALPQWVGKMVLASGTEAPCSAPSMTWDLLQEQVGVRGLVLAALALLGRTSI
jgi:hypothetical protein